MKKILLITLLSLFLFTLTPQTVSAWYGAGSSKGWPHAFNGVQGEVVSPLYKEAPDFYYTSDSITISAQLNNPEENAKTITHPVYVKIWKVTSTDADIQDLTEQELNKSHQDGLDTQSPYKIIKLGDLNLAPSETTTIHIDFTIDEPGYYQFDVTDLSADEDYVPGHIYAAGFLRIKTLVVKGYSSTHEPSFPGGFVLLFASVLAFLIPATLLLFFIFKRRKKKKHQMPTPGVSNLRRFHV